MLSGTECLASTGMPDFLIPVTIAAALVLLGFAVFFLKSKIRKASFLTILVLLLSSSLSLVVSEPAAAESQNCESISTPAPTPSPTPTPDPTPTVEFLFSPNANPQYIWYCPNGVETTVCSSSPTIQLTNSTFTSAGTDPEVRQVELDNTITGYFNVTVKAPSPLPAGSKIGPGLGITCLQRAGATMIGTANGAVSQDWTGAETIDGVQQYHYWYTACSLDEGVTSASFYGQIAPDLQPS